MIIPASAADIASNIDIRQKIHLNSLESVTLTSLAASAFDIKTEPAGFISPLTGLRQHRVQIADRREHLRVSCRIRPRRPPDGGLIDLDHFIDQLEAGDGGVRTGLRSRFVNMLRRGWIKNIVYQR